MGLFSALRSVFGKKVPTSVENAALHAAAHAAGVPHAGYAGQQAAAWAGQQQQQGQPQQGQQPWGQQQQQQQWGQQPQPGYDPNAYGQPAPAPQADDDDDRDGDDFVRNYAMEAVDDYQTFDLANDLGRWYQAEHQIEMAWEDKGERMAKLREFGIRDEPHFYQLRATVERYIQSPHAAQRWGDIGTIMQLKMNATMELHHQQMQQRAQGELSGDLAPFEGVSLEQWAGAQARVASGQPLPPILAELGIDQPKWDRVSAEWNDRMSRDTTCTIATAYGQAFSGAAQGQFGGAAAAGAAVMGGPGSASPGTEADAPIPLERYIEIMVAQDLCCQRGEDAQVVLGRFGINPLSWSNVGAWWSQYMARNMMVDNGELKHRYDQIEAHYRAQYAGPSADGDLSF